MVALAIVTIILWVTWQIKKGARLSYDALFTAAIIGIPSGVIMSRFLHVIDKWDYYINYPKEIIGGDGLTIYGAILGGALGIWVYSRFSEIEYGYMADLIAPGLILGQIIGRIGCTINGCCYGTECSLPWAIIYNHPDSLAIRGTAFHPTTVYEIIFLLIIFIIIMLLKDRLRPDGSLFLVYLSFYSAWRIGIDFIRDGTAFIPLFDLHQAQVIGIIVLLVTIPVLIMRTRCKSKSEVINNIE
jgi:phosphatidylglycerol:prolipoprotein diacylglycerol transferase